MIFLILGCLALLLLVYVGRSGRPVRLRREWRFLPASGAIVCLLGAALLAIREAWIPAIVVGLLGLSLMGGARLNLRRRVVAAPAERMTESEARSILGVGPEATRDEILAAYRRLMERVHPDKGGASGLAAQLNAARDRLLGK